ncbi:MAG: hypothetical protein VX000_17895, partial [Myxococcota bacterium]|nr:hypothetical protein [Myxococcota bacterium]
MPPHVARPLPRRRTSWEPLAPPLGSGEALLWGGPVRWAAAGRGGGMERGTWLWMVGLALGVACGDKRESDDD